MSSIKAKRTKRTNEQRAMAYAERTEFIPECPYWIVEHCYLDGIRSERRAVRKEIGERLNALLESEKRSLSHTALVGIRVAMATLNIKETKP